MIKASSKNKEGNVDLVFIGLSEGNLTRLFRGDPIVFLEDEVGIKSNGSIVIAYEKSSWSLIKSLSNLSHAFSLTDKSIEVIKNGFMKVSYPPNPEIEFVFFYGQSEQAMYERFVQNGLIGQNTETILKNWVAEGARRARQKQE